MDYYIKWSKASGYINGDWDSMIVRKLTLKIHKNGAKGKGYKRGLIVVPSETTDYFRWEEQDLIVVLMSTDEIINNKKMIKSISVFKKQQELEKELELIKGEDNVKFDKI